ncbi:ABC transporter permease [Gilvimarinus polysaccharolyticus]|uniref:ABC transporter permease n=1 Tax=Gilvimarinus polysaccharolyticus TaxID=863921 RepID=UPI0006738162|nr:FtsX-like permease family protein [Gilvimarinus polysaccharolyticus]
MLALRLLWRNCRAGEIKLLATAIMLSVAVVSTIAVFTDRLESTLLEQSNSLLGADKLVASNRLPEPAWQTQAATEGIEQSRVAYFASMVFAGDEMHLAAVKAVEANYPLRGYIDLSQTAFAIDNAQIERASGVPAEGEVWVDSRLLPLLNIELGDELQVGERSLKTTRVIIDEPDGSGPFSVMGARVMMNWADLVSTDVIQPGSRVEYQWLLAAEPALLTDFMAWLEPELSEHEEVMDIENAQRRLQGTLQTGRRFLVLAAIMGVLLAGVAIALAARQFAERHIAPVALLKSLGSSTKQIRYLYIAQLVMLAFAASLVGLLLGGVLQTLVAEAVVRLYQVVMAPASVSSYVLSFVSGPLALLGFALPALWFLPTVPPVKVLRSELVVKTSAVVWQVLAASVVLVVLIAVFSRNLTLALTVIAALAVVALLAVGLAYGLLLSGRKLGSQAGSYWRLAWASIQRRRAASVLQVVVFATAMMLLLTLTVVRTSLIDEWQVKVPDNAPNHFLLNIAPAEVDAFGQLLNENQLTIEQLYPMVRGRLTQINGQPKSQDALNREAQLTWSQTLAANNELVEGQWWDAWQRTEIELPGVSVEVEVAERLGIKLGDKLTFSIGGLVAEAQVASLRSLQWESLQPNFYFIFEPGALDDYSPMYMTSVYLAPEKKRFINALLTRYPTIVVVELDRIINQIRTIIAQVSDGVQMVLIMVLLGGCLVLMAAVSGSLESRKQEVGLLRTLGASRRLMLGSVLVEFGLLGLASGLIAVLASEVLLLGLQVFVFDVPVQPHYWYWLGSPLAGAVLVGLLGAFSCRRAVVTPPAIILREAQ